MLIRRRIFPATFARAIITIESPLREIREREKRMRNAVAAAGIRRLQSQNEARITRQQYLSRREWGEKKGREKRVEDEEEGEETDNDIFLN